MKIEKSHLVKETTGGVSVRRSLNFSEGAEFPTYRLPLQCWLSGGMCCPGQHVLQGVSAIVCLAVCAVLGSTFIMVCRLLSNQVRGLF